MSLLTPKERADRWAAFQKMNTADRVDYVWTYYWLPIVLLLTALAFVGYTVYRQVTKKEVVLYAAYLNISAGSDLEAQLNEGFLSAAGYDPRKNEIYLYRNLYITGDPSDEDLRYAYTSNLKLMAAASAEQLDVVFMNREAYDRLSQKGYLQELPELLPKRLYVPLEPYLTTNGDAVNGLEVSGFPLFQDAAFSDAVYFGVVTDSPRLSAAVQYMEYLADRTTK